MKTITSNKQFNDLVKSGKPFVIDFYADWYGPCQSLLPIVDKLSKEYEETVTIVTANVDKQKELAAKFRVRSIPALFFMKENKIKDSMLGMGSEKTLRKKIDALV